MRDVEPSKSLEIRFPVISSFWDYELNKLTPSEVSARTRIVVFLKCEAGHKWQSNLNVLTKRGDRADICQSCFPTKRGVVTVEEPDFLEWWDDKRVSPNEVSCGSKKIVLWKCPLGHNFRKSVVRFNMKCPTCDTYNKSVAVRVPYLIPEWSEMNELSPYIVSYNSGKKILWECEKCEHTWDARVDQRVNKKTGCPQCAIRRSVSKAEEELYGWLTSTYPELEIIRNDRKILKGQEIDLLFPASGFAIEFNGLYWHSETQGKDERYHYNKWKSCLSSQLRLFQIWEDDWTLRKDIVKKLISYNLYTYKPAATLTKLSFSEITSLEASNFLDKNHLLGSSDSSICYGLKSGEELVAVSTWDTIETKAELVRCATVSSYMYKIEEILMGFIDCLSSSVQKVVVIAYNDTAEDYLYKRLGFYETGVLPPVSSYIVDKERVSKARYHEKALSNDVPVIWDSGRTEYTLPLENRV